MADDIPLETPLAAVFPLPFRVLLLGGVGILCWATNLHGLHLLGIDVVSVLEIGSHIPPQHSPSHIRSGSGLQSILIPNALYTPVYNLFLAYTLWTLFGWLFFRYCTQDDILFVDAYKYIPIVVYLVILIVLVAPYNVFYRHERDRFLLALQRCISTTTKQPIYFVDIILADILTSFAKVIGDIWLSMCMLVPNGSLLIFPTQSGWIRLIVPCLISIPYLVRFKQCCAEYLSSNKGSLRPLFNALKYASSFPVIFLSAAQRTVVNDLVAEKGDMARAEPWHGEHPLFRMWLLAVIFNSLFSFWWDVTNDWGLHLLRFRETQHHGRSNGGLASRDTAKQMLSQKPGIYPWGLRQRLLFPLPAYPLAIFLNLILRLTWSLKLSSHLHIHADGAMFIFGIEIAELLRRWMWVFFRVEWETIRRAEDEQVRIEEAEMYSL